MSAAAFKKALLKHLQDRIGSHRPLLIKWTCPHCRKPHQTDLLENVASVSAESFLELASADGQPLAAIHYTTSRKPNRNKIEAYAGQPAAYIQIELTDDPLASISAPVYVGKCLNPVCATCGGYTHEKNLFIIDTTCWKCSGPLRAAVIEWDGCYAGPEDFSPEELTMAGEKNVIIKTNYSHTVKEAYLSNTCPWCHTFIGNFYLPEHYFEAVSGYLPFERVSEGFFCKSCHDYKPAG